MEGCPRSSMLSIDLKDSIPVEFTDSLNKYITDHYQEDPENYKHECSQFEQLRATCLHPSLDHSGCSMLRRYFAQLQFLQSRFPMVDDGAVAIQFTWTDLYSEESIALADVRFEQAAILHNLGALHSQLGAQEDRTAEEGMKVSCTHFQAAAGVFEYLKNTVMVPLASMKLPWVSEDHFAVPFFDLASCVLQLYINILLGQAQECLLEKSILDGRKDSLIARISMQVYDYYQQALGILESLGSSYLGSKKSKMWTKAVKIKACHFTCVSYIHMANNAHENQKFGEKVTYLKAANEKLTEAQKQSKGQPERTLELLQFMTDVVGNQLEGAVKDNDFIYHEVVPDLSTLPAIKGASLVKPIPFQPCDPSVSGPDIFQRLIPMEAHSDASIYSEEKAKLLRRYSASIEVKNKQLVQSLANLHIDDLLKPVETDALPVALKQLNTEAQRKEGGLLTHAEDNISESTNLSEEIESTMKNISSMLEEDVRKEQLAKVPHGDAAKERDDIKAEYEKCQDALNKADHTYSELVRVYTAHKQNLELIAGPEEHLMAALPSLNIIDSPVDDGAVQRLRDLIAKVEEMKVQRKSLEESLRSKLNQDDITGLLVTREGNKMAFFDEQLRKHDKACSLIQANLDAQDKILSALTDANAKYAKTRQAVKENSQRREEVIQALIASHNTFCELQEKLNKGVEFYKQLSSTVKKIEEKCKNFFDNHSKELDKLIEKEKAPPSKPPSRPSAAKPNHLVRPPPQMPNTPLPGQTDFPPGNMYQHMIPGPMGPLPNTSMPPGTIPPQPRPGQAIPSSFLGNQIPHSISSPLTFPTPHIPADQGIRTAPRMPHPSPANRGQIPQPGQFSKQNISGPGSPSPAAPGLPNQHLPDVSTTLPQVRPSSSQQPDILGGQQKQIPEQQVIRPQLPGQHPPGGPPDLISQVRPPFSSQNSIPFQHGHPMSLHRPTSLQSPTEQHNLPPRYEAASSFPIPLQPRPTASSSQPRQPFQPSTSVPSSIHQGFPGQRGTQQQQIRPQLPMQGPPFRPDQQTGPNQQQQLRPQLPMQPQFRPDQPGQQQQFGPQQQMQGPRFRPEHQPGQQKQIRPQQPMQSQFRPELQPGQQQQFRPQSPIQPQFRPEQQFPQTYQPNQIPCFQPRQPLGQLFRADQPLHHEQVHQPFQEQPPRPQFRPGSPLQQPLRPEIPPTQQQRPQLPTQTQFRPGQQPLQPQQFRPNSPQQQPHQLFQQQQPFRPSQPPLSPQQQTNQPLPTQHQIRPQQVHQQQIYRPQRPPVPQFQRPPTSLQQPIHPQRPDQNLPQPLLPQQLNNQQKQSEEKSQPLSPSQPSQQRFRRDQPSQQPFRPDQPSQQPFRPDQSSQQPFRLDQSSQQPFRPDQSSQQPFRPDQSSQQPFRPYQSSQQPFRPDQSSQQPFQPDQSSQQPFRQDQSSQQPFRPDQSSQQPFRPDQSSQQLLSPNQTSQPFPPGQSSQNLFRPDKPSNQTSHSSQQPSSSQSFTHVSSQQSFREDQPSKPFQSSQSYQQPFQVHQHSVSQSRQDFQGPFHPGQSTTQTMTNDTDSQSFLQQNRTPNAQSYPETGAFLANQSSLPYSYGGRPTPSLLSQGSRPFPNNVTSSDYLTSYSVALAQTQLSQYQNTSSQQQQMQQFHNQLLLQQQQLIQQQQEMLKQQQTQQHSYDSEQMQIGLLLQQILQQQKQLSDLESKLKSKSEHENSSREVSEAIPKATVDEEKKPGQSEKPDDNKESKEKPEGDILGVNPKENEKVEVSTEDSKPPVSTTFVPDYEAAGKWFAAFTEDSTQNDSKAEDTGIGKDSTYSPETDEQHEDTVESTEANIPIHDLDKLDNTEEKVHDVEPSYPVVPDKKESKDDLPVVDETDSDNDIDILDEDEDDLQANEEARRRELEEEIKRIKEFQNKPTVTSSNNVPIISCGDLPNITSPSHFYTIPPSSGLSTLPTNNQPSLPTYNNQPTVTGTNSIPSTSSLSTFYEPGQVPTSIPNKPGTIVDNEDNKPSLLRQCGHYYGSQISSIDQTTNNSCLNDDESLQALISAVKGYDLVVKSLSAEKQGTNSDGFSIEWRELNRLQEHDSLSLTTHAANMNQPKNRYKYTLPWDHSRVTLMSKNNSDYINANIIKNITPLSPTFIATQGPTTETLTDFWLMIWEQQSHLVVMLTREVEENKLMCHQYWPIDEGHAILFGPIRVTLKTLVTNPLMVKRVMHVQHTDSQDTLIVTQLQFCGWPDKGVPESPESLLTFVADTRSCYELSLKESDEERPVIVHCSAGIGRTGTFITIYSAMQEFDAHREFVNIPRLVRNLRLQRKYMVQKKEQYMFCYKTVLFYARQFLDLVLSTLSQQKRASLDLSQLDFNVIPSTESSQTPLAKRSEIRFLGEVRSDDDLDDNVAESATSSQSISQKYCRGTLETDKEDNTKERKSAGEMNINTARSHDNSTGKVLIGKDKEVRFTKDDEQLDEDEETGTEDQAQKDQNLKQQDQMIDSQTGNDLSEQKHSDSGSQDISEKMERKSEKASSVEQTSSETKENSFEEISDNQTICETTENVEGKGTASHEQNIDENKENPTEKLSGEQKENCETKDNSKEKSLPTSEEPSLTASKEGTDVENVQNEPVERHVDTTGITNNVDSTKSAQDKSSDNHSDLSISTERTEPERGEENDPNADNKQTITEDTDNNINSSSQTENEKK